MLIADPLLHLADGPRAVCGNGSSGSDVSGLESESTRHPWVYGGFTTTRWSVILEARSSSPGDAANALETLCRNYWFPLYCFVRRQGHSPADAEDLTQGFFAKLLEKHYLDQVQREKGKFRTFLLAALSHYLSDRRDHSLAAKRGGGKAMHIDIDDAECRYGIQPTDTLTPEKVYERKWVNTLLEHALERLREEQTHAGKVEYYEVLKPFLVGEKADVPWPCVASQLKVTEVAVKSALYRLRRRYRELVRAEVAETVSQPWEVEEEIQHLIRVLSE